VDRRFKTTNAAIAKTKVIPGDYGFPIHLDYLDLDVQIDRFLHSGPDDFSGRLVAVDYEKYEPRPDATPTPAHVKAYIAALRKHIGNHPILLYAGKSFWESPPSSGQLSDYGPNVHLWAPWYWRMSTQEQPRTHYHIQLVNPGTGWWQRFGGALPVMSQYCIGRVAGIPLDCNAYRGTISQLRELTKAGTPTDPTDPVDPPEPPPPPGDGWPKEAPPKERQLKPQPNSGAYHLRHPTRYEWTPIVRDYVYHLFRTFNHISINTYHKHPGAEISGGAQWANRDTRSYDVWDRRGRGYPIDKPLGNAIVQYLMSDPGEPYIDWIIWDTRVWRRSTGRWSFFASDSFNAHRDHIHETTVGDARVIP
jgi:hypothetical protein